MQIQWNTSVLVWLVVVCVAVIPGSLSYIGATNMSDEKNSAPLPPNVNPDPFASRVDALMKQMTLEEKLGQLNLRTAGMDDTGPKINQRDDLLEGVKAGRIGTLFNAVSVNFTKQMQQLAMDNTRLKIPLFFGFDVIHGYKTVFPVPLAEASSWDLEAVENSSRIQATEAAAGGVHWAYAPMVDIARDPRWGRVVEGSGEDVLLGSRMAAARVRGLQGRVTPNTVYNIDEVMGSVKHYAAYGAAIAGRDYNTVDVSEIALRETYLPPFKAAVDAGVATIMTSFNELNGVPATANKWLIQRVLRGEWGYPGFIVTDYTAIPEMINHGVAADDKGVALLAKNAGIDLDMEGSCFIDQLPDLIAQGKVSMENIDNSVRLILRAKFQLGLFDDPFRYCNEEREKNSTLTPQHLAASQHLAEKSIVLLKNAPASAGGPNVLPLSLNVQSIALIGPLADSAKDALGPWFGWGEAKDGQSLKDGIAAALEAKNQGTSGNATNLIVVKGCEVNTQSVAGFDDAIAAAKQADQVILAMGESYDMSGEAASRSNIRLPGVQEDLILRIMAAVPNKRVVLVLMNGRPLDLSNIESAVPAILETWFLGSRAGSAISNVLFGNVSPSGKLPITFPRNVGQVPLYYNHKNTGRPKRPEAGKYCSQYLDVDNSPLYPFGWGLSYNTYEYSGLTLTVSPDPATGKPFESVTIQVTVANKGTYPGREVVQLYIRDEIGSVTRPVQELKGFQIASPAPGTQQTVSFTLQHDDLSFYSYDDSLRVVRVFEPGWFTVFVGGDSVNTLQSRFEAL